MRKKKKLKSFITAKKKKDNGFLGIYSKMLGEYFESSELLLFDIGSNMPSVQSDGMPARLSQFSGKKSGSGF